MQERTNKLSDVAKCTGLKITMKTKIMRLDKKCHNRILVNNKTIDEVDKFVYLGATLSKTGGAEADIDRRFSLAREAFVKLDPVWRSTAISSNTMLRVFNSNVFNVLMFYYSTQKPGE